MTFIGHRRLTFALAVAGCAALLAVQLAVTVDAAKGGRMGIGQFLAGLACIESGGRFDAVNRSSGAFGKYQVMPRNWPAWAARYLGNRWARPSPRNQEYVVHERILDLYEKRRTWRLVAYWWLTGNGDADESLWSRQATGYVNKVMEVAHRAAHPGLGAGVPERCFPLQLPSPVIRTRPFPKVLITGGSVNVRHAPGYENRRLALVKRGMHVALLGSAKDARGDWWLRIGLRDGSTGWIAARFAHL
ncbi:MAG: SH3 domain-containing protein [Candidatus Limnocylindrales bacterium]